VRGPLAAFLSLLAALAAGPVAAVLPVRAELIATGASSPVDIVHAPADATRLFVVEQSGRIRILRNGALAAAPFLDLGSLVATGGERGLLGLAFHPLHATNGRFFVDYTRAGDGATVIAAYRASASDPDRADPESAQVLLTIAQPFENHNGGALRFGPDGFLYIGAGDGGSGNDPGNRAQNPNELLGKMLRIDVDHATPYANPPDNAFAATGLGRPEIWALGLRNPWRFSFDRVTGDLYIGDVGQDAEEEIDFLPRSHAAGANFGWRVVEGDRCTGLSPNTPCTSPDFVAPILRYPHGPGCSVTGGVVYRGRKVPTLYGRYLYGDYCSGQLFAAARDANGQWQTELVLDADQKIGTFGEDADGEAYWSDLATGAIYRLAADTVTPVAIEYYNATLHHYFLTAFPEEAAALDAGAFNGAWQRTGFAFGAFHASEPGAVDVCRFFGTPNVGPDSHFYTADPQECALLNANPLWQFEAMAFGMRLPVAGACPPATRPVYRLYNNPSTVAQVNHRYTVDGATYAAMQAAGWVGEGVALCAK
jgi:glucose/arabinose dehydrogenase